jgi:hypothetical protein
MALVIIGTLFLVFIQFILFDLELKNDVYITKEVPMKKRVLRVINFLRAILLLVFSLGTSMLANACLQA